MSELDKKFNLVDEATPVGEYLTAHYKRCVGKVNDLYNGPYILTFPIVCVFSQELRPLHHQRPSSRYPHQHH